MEELRTLTTRLPAGSKAYVFGSFLRSNSPRDLDILIVYDQDICPPPQAYQKHQMFLSCLGEHLAIPIDVTLLTKEEVLSSRFIEDTGAICLENMVPDLPVRAIG
jgi:predicted nucleotidyltransferase